MKYVVHNTLNNQYYEFKTEEEAKAFVKDMKSRFPRLEFVIERILKGKLN